MQAITSIPGPDDITLPSMYTGLCTDIYFVSM